MRKNAVLFLASSVNIGLTAHFARQVVDMHRKGLATGWDTWCVSDRKEQNAGLWQYVRQGMPAERIVDFDDADWAELYGRLQAVCAGYRRVVIHFQGFNQLWRLRGLLSMEGVRAVLTVHSFPKRPAWRRWLVGGVYAALAERYVRKMVFLSPFALNGFVLGGRLRRLGRVVHIPFCLPEDVIGAADIGERVAMPEGKFVVSYLANFLPNKGHERFLPAMVDFARRHTDVEFYFWGEGPRREAVMSAIRRGGISGRMHCPGRVERRYVPSILRRSSLAMVLSATENAGHAFVEPALYGCPVVGTRVGSAEYLIQEYTTSIGIDTPASLRSALEYAYAHPDALRGMAERMQGLVRACYGYEEMLAAYYRLYAEVAEA